MENTNTNSCSADCKVCACTESEKKSFFSFLQKRVEFRRVTISPDTDRCDIPGLGYSRFDDATINVYENGCVDVSWIEPVYNLRHFLTRTFACFVWGLVIAILILAFWSGYTIALEELYTTWGWI